MRRAKYFHCERRYKRFFLPILVFVVTPQAVDRLMMDAVEQIKAQGYTIQRVSVGGAGAEANPNVFQVVMTK
jgi:hypothetical protein